MSIIDKVCEQCGVQLKDVDKFCPNCGSAIEDYLYFPPTEEPEQPVIYTGLKRIWNEIKKGWHDEN